MGIEGLNGNNYFYTIRKNDNLTKIAKANNTTIDKILELNKSIKNPNLIYAGSSLILEDNKPFKQQEDYDSKKLNISEVKINGEVSDVKLKSNFYANQNLDKLGNTGEKVTVSLQGGKEANVNDLNGYSILNKLAANYLNNNSIILEENGIKRPQNQEESVKSTEFYKAFISEDVNGDNFDADGNLIPRDNKGNNVQLPTVGKDCEGNTYFVLHGTKETLYFDSKGNKAEFKDNKINNVKQEKSNTLQIEENQQQPIKMPENNREFLIPEKYDEKALNLGAIFVNGELVKSNSNANFYRNEINNYARVTLNDNKFSRLDVQLKVGNTLNPKYNDDSADSILKKHLGNNCDKVSIYQNKSNNEALELLKETDLYKAFVSEAVNGNNFENGKLKSSESGYNTVQLPALEVDKNNTKYYVLHTEDKILYFDEKGNTIDI